MEILSKTVEKMSSYTTNSDIKQVFAVMENEIVKFLRGKKIYIYLAIIGLHNQGDRLSSGVVIEG